MKEHCPSAAPKYISHTVLSKAASQGLVEHQQRAAAQIGNSQTTFDCATSVHIDLTSRHTPDILPYSSLRYTSVECMAGMCILSNSERQVKHYDDPV